MWSTLILLLVTCFGSEALNEGDDCDDNGKIGICAKLTTCESAKLALENEKKIVVCDVVNLKAIVCCHDELLPDRSLPGSTPKSVASNECPPISARLTSPKTGQKAWDKCLEYQEKLIYPCVSDTLTRSEESKIRADYCLHSADQGQIRDRYLENYEYPYVAFLGNHYDDGSIQWFCGGSLISERFVLTAAACSSLFTVNSRILIGGYTRTDLMDTSKLFTVKRFINHPAYIKASNYQDIALLELDRDVALSFHAVPACLHTGDDINDTQVMGIGQSVTYQNGSTHELLKKVILDKVSSTSCSSTYYSNEMLSRGLDDYHQVCYVGKEENKDMCPSDAGAAIQIKSTKINCMYTIIGLVSFGTHCGNTTVPSVYTRIAPYIPWIESVVWP